MPSPITNSGEADGGWMDNRGIVKAGIEITADSPYPINGFYSNRAYDAPGFCTMTLEAEPFRGDDPYQRLRDYTSMVESDGYRTGRRAVAIDPIADPQEIGSSASSIVHHSYTLAVAPGPTIPGNLMAATTVALLRFPGKTDIFLRAVNLETENLDYKKILGSIQFDGGAITPEPERPSMDMAALFGAMTGGAR
jgi:hypothetical protein